MDTKGKHFLMLHNDYEKTYVGVFSTFSLLDFCVCDNKHASEKIFIFIDDLLCRKQLDLNDCLFIAANQGPGPFTTLRTVLTSVNGLAYATHQPLIGVDSIQTFVQEYNILTFDYTIALMNAFSNDVYYAILDNHTNNCSVGYASFEKTLGLLSELKGTNLQIIGDIAHLHRNAFAQHLSNKNVVIPDPCPKSASLQAMGKQAYQQWCNQQGVAQQLMPLYLKQTSL